MFILRMIEEFCYMKIKKSHKNYILRVPLEFYLEIRIMQLIESAIKINTEKLHFAILFSMMRS